MFEVDYIFNDYHVITRRHAASVLARLPTIAVSVVVLAMLIADTGCGGGPSQQSPPPSNQVVFSPSSGPVGTVVTIGGADFSSTQSASIGAVPAVIITRSSSSLAAIVMPGAASGAVSVTTSGGTLGGNGTFTVTPTGVPKTQQGSKLTGSGNAGESQQGYSVALSADGNTAALGGVADNSSAGAVWIFVRSGTTWSQQGNKLVGDGAVASAVQGYSVALSADGNALLVGAPYDDSHVGAAWIFTRSGSTWTQQGGKLIGTGAVGTAWQGTAVALSADGNTALVSGPSDGSDVGAVWFYTRAGSAWTQQGDKVVGTGSVFSQHQGTAVALSSDGSTALVGAFNADLNVGATWVFTRSGTTWTQQGEKLVGTGGVGRSQQGTAAAISADGNTALRGC